MERSAGAAGEQVLLAVNGGLMRGLYATGRMTEAGAVYVREAVTEPAYRMWSVGDKYPAMLRGAGGTGNSITVEVWSVTPAGLLQVFDGEPPALSIGRVALNDGTRVLSFLGDAALVEGQREITKCGGWRTYIQAEGIPG